MRRRTRPLVALLVVLAAAAAGAPAGAQDRPAEDTVDPAIVDGTAARRLAEARATWRAAGVRDYRMRMGVGCFCPFGGPFTVTVVDGRVAAAPRTWRHLASVTRLHRLIARAIRDEAHVLVVRYGRNGEPRRVQIDERFLIADEELDVVVGRMLHTDD